MEDETSQPNITACPIFAWSSCVHPVLVAFSSRSPNRRPAYVPPRQSRLLARREGGGSMSATCSAPNGRLNAMVIAVSGLGAAKLLATRQQPRCNSATLWCAAWNACPPLSHSDRCLRSIHQPDVHIGVSRDGFLVHFGLEIATLPARGSPWNSSG